MSHYCNITSSNGQCDDEDESYSNKNDNENDYEWQCLWLVKKRDNTNMTNNYKGNNDNGGPVFESTKVTEMTTDAMCS